MKKKVAKIREDRYKSLNLEHMKSMCVLCKEKLVMSAKRYEEKGNFCETCSGGCTQLASYFPYENPELPQEEVNKLSRLPTIRRTVKVLRDGEVVRENEYFSEFERYYEKLLRYKSNTEIYNNLQEDFQAKVATRLDYNERKYAKERENMLKKTTVDKWLATVCR